MKAMQTPENTDTYGPKTELHIYGAGMAGLLAASMLRRLRPIVHERQSSLPDNHGALLRFRSDEVARETGQTFKKVRVHKAVCVDEVISNTCTLREANMYSVKVTGKAMERSIMNLESCDRYIAPAEFTRDLLDRASCMFGEALNLEVLSSLNRVSNLKRPTAVISTIPMPVMMNIVGWRKPEFKWRPIWSLTAHLGPNVDLHQTIYYPGGEPFYRASITGSTLIIESMMDISSAADAGQFSGGLVGRVLAHFGLTCDYSVIGVKRQEYGKLLPIDEYDRQKFILHMTDEFRVYSVGRFATWRQILLDDVVKDIRQVSRWIDQRSGYRRRLEA